jgi:hypothetical protein
MSNRVLNVAVTKLFAFVDQLQKVAKEATDTRAKALEDVSCAHSFRLLCGAIANAEQMVCYVDAGGKVGTCLS